MLARLADRRIGFQVRDTIPTWTRPLGWEEVTCDVKSLESKGWFARPRIHQTNLNASIDPHSSRENKEGMVAKGLPRYEAIDCSINTGAWRNKGNVLGSGIREGG